jgi:hypothetical protein
MVEFIVGGLTRGGDFWFRKEFVANLWVSVRKHNILLIAPRRIGKTSVMYRMLDHPKKDWLVIHLNVEHLRTPEDFFITLVDAIREHQPDFLKDTLVKGLDFLRSVFNRVESVEAYELKVALRKAESFKDNWMDRATELIDRVIRSEKEVLFIIDELPDMLNAMLAHSPGEWENFLHWFRKTRERCLRSNVRWMVGGSVNLITSLAQQGKVSLINDLKPEMLEPFTAAEVGEFAATMFKHNRVPFDDTAVPRMLDLLGAPIPYFLQMLTQELCRKWKRTRSGTITADTVNEVFTKVLLGEMARDKLQHYRVRIDTHYPAEERQAACRLLDQLSLTNDGIARSTLFQLYRMVEEGKTERRSGRALEEAFRHLLLYLQSDFYIEEVREGYYDFSSRLLKTWWKKYYGYECGGK